MVEKRLHFALKMAEGQLPVESIRNLSLKVDSLAAFLKALLAALAKNKQIAELLANVTGGNMREVMELITRFISTPNVDAKKIIEEGPAPHVKPRLIERIGEKCAEACRKLGYRGAGTFEFLYEKDEFFFIEMNTRVQVEHPVTELITGVDIVQEQIRVAAGLKLRYRQKDIVKKGHAIECRINAENPYTFVPSPGRITQYHVAGGPGIRYDSHVYANYYVPPHDDSLIGKLLAYGDTREQAIARMLVALSEMVIEGIQTNIPLHQELMNDAAFVRGGVSIHYLEEKMAALKSIQAEA